MFNKLFPAIECEDSDAVMDFAAIMFFGAMIGALLAVALFMVCVYVL